MIEVEALSKSYDERPAVQDLSFSVPTGQVLGFLGPNGAGKSTTMRILTGYLAADSGRVAIGGFDVGTASREVRRRVGYMPETAPLYGEMRVSALLSMVCRLHGLARGFGRSRIEFALEACGLSERRHDVIGRLSKGLRQRVALAQAVVHDPEVLILDEPTAGLDPAQTKETRDLIVELGRSHTVILSSHILSEVSQVCQRVLILNQGRLVADGAVSELSAKMALGAARRVQMVVAGAEEALKRALARVPQASGASVAALAGDEIEVSLQTEHPGLEDELAQAVIAEGLKLRRLEAQTPDLEDVYLALTGNTAP